MKHHHNCREGWGCHPACTVALFTQTLKANQTVDAGTALDMIQDLQLEIRQLRERIRELEAQLNEPADD